MAILPNTFCIFILTHGRPDNVITLKTLDKCGYTGRLYLVVDDEDKAIDRYRRNFGAERVIVFDKKAEADACDEGNNFDEHRTILMARNACFKIAERLGVTHFIELDDDYYYFGIRFHEGAKKIVNLNATFSALLKYYKSAPITSIAFAQGGDHIGGFSGVKLKRKCMNSFLCSTERPFRFIGAMNEDVNTFVTLGSNGLLFLTFTPLQLDQKDTQSQANGITGMYQRFGTYCKAFTTVMMLPSAVKVSMMQSNNPRIHHAISWKQAVPCIVPEKYRKEKAAQNKQEVVQTEKNQPIIDRTTLAYDSIKEYNQALLQNPPADDAALLARAAAMRQAIRPMLVNPPFDYYLTWPAAQAAVCCVAGQWRRNESGDIEAWYSAAQLRDVLAVMQAATAAQPDRAERWKQRGQTKLYHQTNRRGGGDVLANYG